MKAGAPRAPLPPRNLPAPIPRGGRSVLDRPGLLVLFGITCNARSDSHLFCMLQQLDMNAKVAVFFNVINMSPTLSRSKRKFYETVTIQLCNQMHRKPQNCSLR
jgi:hypothetical protein